MILSLAGGGYRGIFSIYVLREIEEALGRPIAECFDLIAGTSIGGIIALGLALKVSCSEIIGVFEKQGGSIFPPQSSFQKMTKLMFQRPFHSQAALAKAIEAIAGKRTIRDLKQRVVIPAFNLTTGRVQMFKTPHCENLTADSSKRIIDVGLATSAAPLYFSPAELQYGAFADGGLFANSPDQIALHEALCYLQVPLEQIYMMSIATPQSSVGITHDWRAGQGSKF
jgi:patatin-like phospholipase/acyl hydrolase